MRACVARAPQGGCSLQRNLEVQEMTLKVQMDLQEELSRQLQLQKRLQTEMECMMNARAAEASALDETSATSSKMNNILALREEAPPSRPFIALC